MRWTGARRRAVRCVSCHQTACLSPAVDAVMRGEPVKSLVAALAAGRAAYEAEQAKAKPQPKAKAKPKAKAADNGAVGGHLMHPHFTWVRAKGGWLPGPALPPGPALRLSKPCLCVSCRMDLWQRARSRRWSTRTCATSAT
jgi:hypothetical protein